MRLLLTCGLAVFLGTAASAPAFAGLVLTEVNPTHDPGGEQLARYVAAIAAAVAAPGRPA